MPDANVPEGYVLPEGVAQGQPGNVEFFTQRIDGRPYVNCMPYTACALIEFSGVNVPKDFGMRVREGSGVAVRKGRGMSVAELKRGVAKVLPFSPLYSALRSNLELLESLQAGQFYGLMIDFSRVPAGSPLRLFVGGYQGGHAGWAAGARRDDAGRWQILWFDPFARAGHRGRWLGWRHFRSVVLRSDGLIRTFFTEEGEGLMEFPISYEQHAEVERALNASIDRLSALVEASERESERRAEAIRLVASMLMNAATMLEGALAEEPA